MSSDETDTPAVGSDRPKVLRRIRKVWIDESIGQLWNFVDHHYNPRSYTGLLKAGGKPLHRYWESSSSNTLAPPNPKLPSNFYNRETITGKKLKSLQPGPVVELPDVRSFSSSELITNISFVLVATYRTCEQYGLIYHNESVMLSCVVCTPSISNHERIKHRHISTAHNHDIYN